MTARSAGSVVTFMQSLKLGTQPETLPAGAYNATTDEELIEGLSFAAYHRILTILEVPSIGTASAMKQYLHASAEDLDAALQRDRLSAESGTA